MDVVRDVLDQLVIDRHGREMGRVDGMILDLHPGEPARLSAILIGPSALGERLHPAIGRWVAAFEYALGIHAGRPVRIEFADVRHVEDSVKVDLAIGETAAGVVEQRLRAWLAKILGGR